MIAGRGDVIGRRAEAGNDEEVAAVGEELLYEIPPVQHCRARYLVHCLGPIRRCESRIAT